MIMKKEHTFFLPTLAEESGGSPQPGEQNVETIPSISSLASSIGAVMSAL